MGRFESEDDVYEFCILRKREADAIVRAENLDWNMKRVSKKVLQVSTD